MFKFGLLRTILSKELEAYMHTLNDEIAVQASLNGTSLNGDNPILKDRRLTIDRLMDDVYFYRIQDVHVQTSLNRSNGIVLHHLNKHREEGPAEIWYYSDGEKSEEWYKKGKRHRDDGPAIIFYYNNGLIKTEEWYTNNKKHREEGPAEIRYYKNGLISAQNILSEEWYTKGKLHRKGGPASIEYDSNGNIKSKAWYTNGKLDKSFLNPKYYGHLSRWGYVISKYSSWNYSIFKK